MEGIHGGSIAEGVASPSSSGPDVRGPASRRYPLLRRSEVSLCTANPGFPEELCLRADRRTLIGWWRGDLTLSQARGAGLVLEGRPDWIRAFPNWFERYMFADVALASPAPTGQAIRWEAHLRDTPGGR